MFYIEGLENNTLQMEKTDTLDYEFKVISKKDNGKRIPFFIAHVSNEYIDADIVYGNVLIIHITPSMIIEEGSIRLENIIGESVSIKLIPNEYYTMDKTYTFKLTSKKILDDGSLKLKILSKVNDMEIGWKCTYDGKPMEYSISPFESDKGEYVVVKPMATVLSEFTALLEFTQDESGNIIRLSLTNTPEVGISEAIKK